MGCFSKKKKKQEKKQQVSVSSDAFVDLSRNTSMQYCANCRGIGIHVSTGGSVS
jgi:hypothetical protein